MQPVKIRPNVFQPKAIKQPQRGDWDQMAARGYLDAPGPNANTPPVSSGTPADGYHPRWGEFWPGLVVGLSASLGQLIKVCKTIVDPGVDVHATEGLPRSHYSVFDNTFLLGLRMRAPFRNEATAANGDSSPPLTLANMGRSMPPRPRNWIYPGFTTAWPQAPVTYPTFGGDQ